MDAAYPSPVSRVATTPFDSFYHRRTPRWHYRGALLLAFGGATAGGAAILLSALALLG